MLRSPFFLKVYAAYVVLILLAIAVVGALVGRKVEERSQDAVERSLWDKAVLVRDISASVIDPAASAALQARIGALSHSVSTRLTIIRSDGTVIADSLQDPGTMDNHATRPEVLAARDDGYGTSVRFSDTVGARMMYVAAPVESDGRLVGYVRASLPLAAIDEQTRRLRAIVALGGGLAALVALPLGLFVARWLTRPISLMTSVAESMVEGRYDRRAHIAGRDEVAQLAHALNRMAESAQGRIEAIVTDRNKLLTILASMAEGVVAVDRQGAVLHINAGAASLLDAATDDCLGRDIREVTGVQQVWEAIDSALAHGEEAQVEGTIAAPTGPRVVELRASPLRDGEGGVTGAVVVLDDVSELRRLETVRRDFVANMSHELKTPITAIQMLAETLAGDKNMAGKQRRRFLAKIRDQSTRLSSIVTDLLALSRLESASPHLERKPIDLREVVAASVQPLLPDDDDASASVTADVPDVPVTVVGDDEALAQATRNLLDNALKYTPRDGQVWVRLRQESGHAVIEVEDTGIGIEPSHQDRIFERFYRVDRARSRELGGTGLGLSIVRHIALTHGGSVAVDSEAGVGATFRLTLPSASNSA